LINCLGTINSRWWSTNYSLHFHSTESGSSSSSSKSFVTNLSLADNSSSSVTNSVLLEAATDSSVCFQSSTLIGVHNFGKRGYVWSMAHILGREFKMGENYFCVNRTVIKRIFICNVIHWWKRTIVYFIWKQIGRLVGLYMKSRTLTCVMVGTLAIQVVPNATAASIPALIIQ
jgi:hypothetical protein